MDSNTRKSTVASHQWECMDEQQQAPNNATSTMNYTPQKQHCMHMHYNTFTIELTGHVDCTYNAHCSYSVASSLETRLQAI